MLTQNAILNKSLHTFQSILEITVQIMSKEPIFLKTHLCLSTLILSHPRGEHRVPNTLTGYWVQTPVDSRWG